MFHHYNMENMKQRLTPDAMFPLKLGTECQLHCGQPPESGIGEVGHKRVTSKRGYQYQRLDGEACIFCR
jgi:hypothetical protein